MAQSVLCLDLGTAYIKYLEAKRTGKQPAVISYGMVATPSKGMQSDAAVDAEAMAQTVKRLLADGKAQTREAVVALPESKVFTRVIEVPDLSEKELANSIHWEAEQYVPMPLEEVYMDFSKLRDVPLEDGNKKQEILLIAAPKRLVEKYQKTVELAGLTPVAIETDALSTVRSLTTVAQQPTTAMIVNIGAHITSFSVVINGALSFTRSIEIAGNALTRAVAQEFNFSLAQAEEYKKSYGLDKTKLEGKLVAALSGVYNSILEELRRAVAYHNKRYPNTVIGSLVLTGGTAHLPELVPQLAQELNTEVLIGNSWQYFQIDQMRFPKIADSSVYFSVVCGLALRGD